MAVVRKCEVGAAPAPMSVGPEVLWKSSTSGETGRESVVWVHLLQKWVTWRALWTL